MDTTKLREEFYEKFGYDKDMPPTLAGVSIRLDWVADWWLSKYQEREKELAHKMQLEKQMWVKGIEKAELANEFNDGLDVCKDCHAVGNFH